MPNEKYYTPRMQTQLMNEVRKMLPMETGNLRYNGTYGKQMGADFEITIGGVRADYVEYLEERPESKWFGHIENTIAPHVLIMSWYMMHNKPYVNRYKTRATETVQSKMEQQNQGARSIRLFNSLNRQIDTPMEHPYATYQKTFHRY
jgi:hypothetical protein